MSTNDNTTVVDSADSSVNSKNAHKTSDTTFNPYITHAAPNYHVKVQMLRDGNNDIVRRPIIDDPTPQEYKAMLRRKEKRQLLQQGPSPAFVLNQVIQRYGVTWYDQQFLLPQMRSLASGKLKTHEELFASDPAYREEYIKALQTGELDEMIGGILEKEALLAKQKRVLGITSEQIKRYHSRRRH